MKKPTEFTDLDRALNQPGHSGDGALEPELLEAFRGALAGEKWDEEAAWQKVRGNMGSDSSASAARPGVRRVGGPRPGWPLRIAALLVLGLGLPVLLNRDSKVASSGSVAALDHTTGAGERRTVTLADGTRVMLSPSSTLRVPVTYPAGRAVYLTGEAFFEVAQDAARPFSVHTKQAETVVLGTEFHVRGYAADTLTEVVLVKGRVSVRGLDSRERSILSPGQRAQLSASRAKIGVADDVAIYAEWAAGRISFRDWRLDQITERLALWYGKPITIDDRTLAATRVTVLLHQGSLDDVIAVLAEVAGAEYSLAGPAISIKRKNKR